MGRRTSPSLLPRPPYPSRQRPLAALSSGAPRPAHVRRLALRPDAQRIVSTVAAKLRTSREVAERFQVTSHEHGTKHGLLGPSLPKTETPEADIDSEPEEEGEGDEMADLIEALTGEAYERAELPSEASGELVVRATPRSGRRDRR